MQVESGVLGQPGIDVGVLVGRVVIEDQMDLKALGNLAVDRAQERQELGVAVAREALPDHRAGQNIQRGEQRRGPVALVVVGHRPGPPGLHRQRRLRAIQRLDLGLLVHAQHDRSLGRVQVQADDIGELLLKPRVLGQLERLDPVRLQPASGPDLLDRGCETPCARAIDRQLQCVSPGGFSCSVA